MNKPLDPWLKLHKNTVIGNRRNPAADLVINVIDLGYRRPWIGQALFVAERDLVVFPVELEHLYLNVISLLKHLRGVMQTSPRHIGDMQQAVNAANINERTVFGQVFDSSLD